MIAAPSNRVGRVGVLGAVLALAGVGLSLSGCIGHNNIEPIRGAVGFENPNNAPVPQVMVSALRWLVHRYPPQGGESLPGMTEPEAFAISFPSGVRGDIAEWIVRQTFPGKAQPLTAENESLPIYHIARVWVRGDMAYVDLFRPVPQFSPGPGGKTIYQPFTLHLRGGLKPWTVTGHRIYQPGTLEVPPRTYFERTGENLYRATSGQRPAPEAETYGDKAMDSPSTIDPAAKPQE